MIKCYLTEYKKNISIKGNHPLPPKRSAIIKDNAQASGSSCRIRLREKKSSCDNYFHTHSSETTYKLIKIKSQASEVFSGRG